MNETIKITCGDCRHWNQHDAKQRLTAGAPLTGHAKQMGTCRRYPPVMMLVPTPQGPGMQTFLPSTERQEPACGEFAGRLQA